MREFPPETIEWKVLAYVASALASIVTALAWAWRKALRPWIVATARDSLAKEHLLMTPTDRADAKARAEALLRLEGAVTEHDRALDRLAPLGESVRAVQRQCDQQTEMLSTHTEILRTTAAAMSRVEQSVTYLHDRVERGERTFRRAEDREGAA